MSFLRFFLFFVFSACAANASYVASINPIYQILLVISQDKNNSILLIEPNISEHNYHLKKSDINAFVEADLVFYVDDLLEKNFPKIIQNFKLEAKSYKLSQVAGVKVLQRRNNPKQPDLHLWLNPQNGIKIAEFITEKLCKNEPNNCKKFQKNLVKFRRDVEGAETAIRTKLAQVDISQAVFYHDGYQYFEDYFGIKPAKVMTSDHNQELKISDLREFSNLTRSGNIKCVFGEARDEKNSALKLAQSHNLKFLILDALGSKENFNLGKNGYAALLLNIASDMASCQN